LDLVKALEAFFADKSGVIAIWLDLFSTSQHSTFSKPPEWWQQTFVSAIGRMGQMVMVMTPWDSPVCLTRAWCLIELYACRSSGSSFGVAFPPAERARFLEEISDRHEAFYDMLGKVNTAKSECSRDTDRERIFAAVRELDGGFSALDRGVLSTMTELLQRQLEEEIAGAVACGQADVECRMMNALAGIFYEMGEYERALQLLEKCLAKRKRVLGEDHPDTLGSLDNLAGVFFAKGEYERAPRVAAA
jgi:tetratricopeptide (TPR) repeat protein